MPLAESPQAHLWLNVPETCRIEAELIAEDELVLAFGDRRVDGHTLVFERGALERLHTLVGQLLLTDLPADPRLDAPNLVSTA